MKKYIILLFLGILNNHAVLCMDNYSRDIIIINKHTERASRNTHGLSQLAACCDGAARNQLRLVNTQWHTIASKSNEPIFLCDPLILGNKDKTYYMYYFADEPYGLPAIENLLKNGCKPYQKDDFFTILPMHIALHGRHYEIAKLLQKKYSYESGVTPVSRLVMALYKGDKNELKEILNFDISLEPINHPHVTKQMPIMCIAAHLGHTETVAYLLEYCQKNIYYKKLISKTTKDGDSAFHCAAKNGYLIIVEMLLPHFDINHSNNTGWTALHLAARYGHDKIVEFLLQNKANTERKIHDAQETPLLTAGKHARYACIKLLLEYGANIATKDEFRNTLLHMIAQNKEDTDQIKIANILIARGINVDAKNSNNKTALHLTAISNSCALAKLLINNGATVNMYGTCGRTPLHEAASNNYEDLVKLLLKCGAEKHITDDHYLTAYDWTNKLEYPGIAEMLYPYQQNSK